MVTEIISIKRKQQAETEKRLGRNKTPKTDLNRSFTDFMIGSIEQELEVLDIGEEKKRKTKLLKSKSLSSMVMMQKKQDVKDSEEMKNKNKKKFEILDKSEIGAITKQLDDMGKEKAPLQFKQ